MQTEAAKLRLDIGALHARVEHASEESASTRKQLEIATSKLKDREKTFEEREKSFEERENDLKTQATAYKKMVGDMHRVLESAERKRSRYV